MDGAAHRGARGLTLRRVGLRRNRKPDTPVRSSASAPRDPARPRRSRGWPIASRGILVGTGVTNQHVSLHGVRQCMCLLGGVCTHADVSTAGSRPWFGRIYSHDIHLRVVTVFIRHAYRALEEGEIRVCVETEHPVWALVNGGGLGESAYMSVCYAFVAEAGIGLTAGLSPSISSASPQDFIRQGYPTHAVAGGSRHLRLFAPI